MDSKILEIIGGKRLRGEVFISGAKNAALPGLAATLLSSEPVNISNVPEVDDVIVMINALRSIGADIDIKNNIVKSEIKEIKSNIISGDIVGSIRASILFLGPMLARNGFVKVSQPGGCPIGHRGVDYHFEALKLMGADIEIEGNDIVAKTNGLSGIEYTFPGKTVTGTENIIMAASLAEGSSVLKNCALEPEIDDLIWMLNKMGADIERKDNDTIIIKGQTSLGFVDHRIIPDRIETGTYVILACLNNNRIVVKDTRPELIKTLLDILKRMEIDVTVKEGDIRIKPNENMLPVNVETETYPGLPTDLQAQLMVLLTNTEGASQIKESIFNNRFNHANELNRMGANIGIDGNIARINGKTKLIGKENIIASDLRASAALVLGALIAEGRTTIKNSFQLFRGYERLPEKLRHLGAEIRILD